MAAGAAPRPDLVLRNGTIVDGTGRPPFVGDVAVAGGLISAVGPGLDVRGASEYDARGLVVAPGWIDCHTHFDAQVTWDPYLTPSTANGVTTCIFGNCGIGFAPCQPDRRRFLASLIEAVEDLPGPVIADGMVWDWETFEEYLDSVARRELACDVAVMVGHAAVRTWVLGQRANASDHPGGAAADPVKPHEMEAMAAIVRDAVAAGALGFSTSRLLMHRDSGGVLTPGTLAASDEVLAMARAVAAGGGGTFQWATDWASYEDLPYHKLNPAEVQAYRQRELGWMKQVVEEHGDSVALTWTLGWGNDPKIVESGTKMQVEFLEEIKALGGLAKAQVFVRPQGFLLNFAARLHPFALSPTFQALKTRCESEGEDLISHLTHPEVRDRVLSETQSLAGKRQYKEFFNIFSPWSIVYRWTEHYEPGPEHSVKTIAVDQGREPLHVAYDLLVNEGILWKPFTTWATRDLSRHHSLFEHPQVIPGGDDAGAHHTVFMDATCPSHMMTHWVRDRVRGPRFSLEHAVKKLTADTAELFGLADRGTLLPGQRADLNVFDLEGLRIGKPYYVKDLPLGAERWLQDVSGYRLTLVSGCATFADGAPTGALPGRLVRNPRRRAEAWQGVAASLAGPFKQSGDGDSAAIRARALEGAGSGGTSAAARVLRDVVEEPGGGAHAGRSRL